MLRFTTLPGLLALCLLAFAGEASAQWCQSPEGPYWCGDPDNCAGVCSDPTSDCTTSCEMFGGTQTTCGAYFGAPANDLDSDGVANGSDNCICTANSNQANCDGDAWGDSCDSANELWVFVTDLGRCDWDGDTHWNKFTVEQYGAKRYQNVCDGSFCSDRYLISEVDCHFSTGCGSSKGACCDCHYPFLWCSGGDDCGSPGCPF